MDLLGVVVGSEGTLGIVTEVTLRIVRVPETVRTLLAGFETTDAAGAAVSGIVAAGILPSAIEMMDRLTIEAAETSVAPGYPAGAGAVLLVELDGVAEQVEEDAAEVERICLACGAFELRVAADEAARALLWKGRKSAFAAMGRIATDYYVQDGVVPRTRLPEVLRRIEELSEEHGLRVGNVFHAGDGNLHPLVSTTPREARRRARACSPRRSSRPASTPAARSPASTASAWTRPARCRGCSPSAISRCSPACAGPSTPRGSAIPARSCRRRGSAARFPARTACTRSRGSALPSVSSLEEAAERPRAANAEGRRLRIGDDLTTDGLTRILEHEAGDLTCTVESGFRLSELKAALRGTASGCRSTRPATRRSARSSRRTCPARFATASAPRATSCSA